MQDATPLVRALQQLGMPLYACQPPTGYKDTADAWVNTGALVNRMNIALALASNRMRGVTIDIGSPRTAVVGQWPTTLRARRRQPRCRRPDSQRRCVRLDAGDDREGDHGGADGGADARLAGVSETITTR